MDRPSRPATLLDKDGHEMTIFSVGSTGTYNIDCDTSWRRPELQVGSYIFMDVEYRSIGGKGGAPRSIPTFSRA